MSLAMSFRPKTADPARALGLPLELRDLLAQGRRDIEALHRGGALGVQVVAALSDLFDRIVERAYRAALESVPLEERPGVLQELAVVAVGGYGRGDPSPHSDADLLFLHPPRPRPIIREIVARLVRDLWDIGLKLGHSVRSANDCIALARQDLSVRTALTEARFLQGSAALFADLQRRYQALYESLSINRFIAEALAERAREHQDYYAATVYLLEPNVKKSPGGLRDFHLLRWVALLRCGSRDIEMLRISGALSRADAEVISAACEFLYRLRNELHFHAGAPQDVLTRDEQLRLAAWLDFATQGSLLGVERFMQHYYRHTTALHDAVMRFVEGARQRPRWSSWVQSLLDKPVEGRFLLNRERIAIEAAAATAVLADGASLLRLFDLARTRGVKVEHATLERIHAAAPACEVSTAARASFLQSLAIPRALGGLLRDLHRVGLLSRFLPAFEHARCLIQFNRYHKYTVDEHSLLAVEAALRREADPGAIGQAYREIRHKDILHLALLLHDLGKGLGEDHSEIGRQLAEDIAVQYGMEEPQRGLLVFLVHQHLFMAHTAFRRDVADIPTLVQFARRVGTPETLKMLYAFTAADTEAVGPGSLTAWKESLLGELYVRTMEELTGEAPLGDENARAENVRSELRREFTGAFPADWLEVQIAALPPHYLLTTERDRVTNHLRALQRGLSERVLVTWEFLRDRGLQQLTVFTRDDIAPGIFSKIAGVLAARGFQIAGAQIVTRADGVVMDTFWCMDLEFSGDSPPQRREEVGQRITEVLLGSHTVESLFARRGSPARPAEASPRGPTQVELDNDSSERFTIVEVFADDCQGLLYIITRALLELGLSVASAKISTRLDQVVDAFYVTELATGEKPTDHARLEVIRTRLLASIEAFERAPAWFADPPAPS